jgi:hypothetical protein
LELRSETVSLKIAIDNLKYDSRMIDINFKSQSLSTDELKKHLDKLPDLATASVPVELNGDDTDMISESTEQ